MMQEKCVYSSNNSPDSRSARGMTGSRSESACFNFFKRSMTSCFFCGLSSSGYARPYSVFSHARRPGPSKPQSLNKMAMYSSCDIGRAQVSLSSVGNRSHHTLSSLAYG